MREEKYLDLNDIYAGGEARIVVFLKGSENYYTSFRKKTPPFEKSGMKQSPEFCLGKLFDLKSGKSEGAQCFEHHNYDC